MTRGQPQPGAIEAWAAACALVAFLVVAALVAIAWSYAVVCGRELETIAEPAGWRGWPVLPDDGGFTIHGESVNCVGHGLLCGLQDAELSDERTCPRAGVSLDAWFDGNMYRSRSDIAVRESGGEYVVAAHQAMAYPSRDVPAADEVFLAAFRPRTAMPHLVFRDGGAVVASAFLLGALLILVLAALRARRSLGMAARYGDEALYRSGTRDAKGIVVLDDGTPPLASDGAPGAVLVRVTATREASYREARTTIAAEVVDGTRDARIAAANADAAALFRRGTTAAAGIAALVGVVSAAVAFLESVRID